MLISASVQNSYTYNTNMEAATWDDKSKIIIAGPEIYEPDPKGMGHAYFTTMRENKEKISQIEAATGHEETFGQTLEKCIRTAMEMKNRGIVPGDIISICSGNHFNNFVPFIAAQFIGAIVASLDPTISLKDSEHLIKQVNPKIIFVSTNAEELMEGVLNNTQIKAEIVVFGETERNTPFLEFIEPKEDENDFEPYEVDSVTQTAVILFSSGTTGLSKGICIHHHGLSYQANHFLHMVCSADVVVSFASTYWISTVIVLAVNQLFAKARVIIPKFNAEQLWYDLAKYKVTFMFMAPSHAIQMLKAGRPENLDLTNLYDIVVGGGPFSANYNLALRDLLPGTYIHLLYGQSEANGIVTCFRATDRRDVMLLHDKPSSCGRPMFGFQYKIVDPDTEELLGPNQTGELRYKAKCMMNGYFNRDTSDAYDDDGWICSGDILYFDEDLCFYVVDRIKEMLKFQIFHITPVIIENVLATHPEVQLAIVVGIPHDEDGDHPMGLVIARPGSEVTADELIQYVEDRVEDRYRLRAGLKLISAVPYTPSGKIKKNVLKNMVLAGDI